MLNPTSVPTTPTPRSAVGVGVLADAIHLIVDMLGRVLERVTERQPHTNPDTD
jgi:hypothetical protein